MNNFYVYAYYRKDGTPYYIGKGKDKRAWSNNKRVKKPKDEYSIIILQNNLTEEDAFDWEKYFIKLYGRIDNNTGILRNMTDGGDGVIGHIPSEETRKKMSQSRKGKNNPFYGRTHTEKTKSIISFKNLNTSEETRKKMSESHKGKPAWNKGLKGLWKQSEETCKKRSESIKEYWKNKKNGKI